MDNQVKFRQVSFLREQDDPMRPGEVMRYLSNAHTGQVLHTEEGEDTETDVYGVLEDELARLDRLGAFYTEAEVEARDSGLAGTSASDVMAWMQDKDPSVETLLALAQDDATLINPILNADSMLHEGENREDLVSGMVEIQSKLYSLSPEEPVSTATAEEGDSGVDATDGAREYAAEQGVNLTDVTGTGTGGRITKTDVETYVGEQGT